MRAYILCVCFFVCLFCFVLCESVIQALPYVDPHICTTATSGNLDSCVSGQLPPIQKTDVLWTAVTVLAPVCPYSSYLLRI